jgi:tRNA uridine 5-carboxymethylaminomethyl modification enzyme
VPTSLPYDIQLKMLRSIKGLENVEIMRPGYAIEHDYVNPLQLQPTLETKRIRNLFLAGQINGTTGYEEAAGQGLIAGVNAALKAQGHGPFIIDRSEGYIGVLIDDLVTKGTQEPYRMFTSRAEYRLILREDNADLRLCEKGYGVGLISRNTYETFVEKKNGIQAELDRLRSVRLQPSARINEVLMLRRPEVTYGVLVRLGYPPDAGVSAQVKEQVEIQVKYQGYITRQMEQVERFKKMERAQIPSDFHYHDIPGLSREVQEKLSTVRPLSLGQASRISGITPAAVAVLMVYLKRHGHNPV